MGALIHRFTVAGICFSQGPGMRLAVFQRCHCFEESLLEVATNRHHFACRFHTGTKGSVRGSELVEWPARDLDNCIIESWLKGSSGPLTSDGVGQFIQSISDCNQCRHSRNWITGGLGCKSRRTRYAGVDLNDTIFTSVLVDRKLNIATALDVETANEAKCSISEALMVSIRKSLSRCDNDGLPSVNTHRVDVFHGTNDCAIVVGISHDFVFKFLPSQDALFNQNLPDLRMQDSLTGDFHQLAGIPSRTSTQPTEGKCRTNQNREFPQFFSCSKDLID